MNRTAKASDNEARAAAWLVKLETDTSAAAMASWRQWLSEDDRHRAAYARLESSWRQMDCLRSVRPLDGTVDLDLLDNIPGPRGRAARSCMPDPTALYRSIAVALATGALSSLLVLVGWLFLVSH